MRKSKLLLLAGLVPVVSSAALSTDPAKVIGNGLEITPTLEVGLSSDDNFYTEPSGAEDSALLTTLAPSLLIKRGDEDDNGQLDLGAKAGFVSEDTSDNFLDYRAKFTGNNPVAGNVSLGIGIGTEQGHDARGASSATDACQVGTIVGPAVACDSEPDVWNENGLNLNMTLGGKTTSGSIKMGAGVTARRYSTNGPRTDALEYDNNKFTVTFGWKMSGKTKAVLDTSYSHFDYQSTFDNTQAEYLFGVEWDAKATVGGYAKFGYQAKDFRNPASKDIDDPAWKVGLKYAPTNYTTLNLDMSQSYEESSGIGNAKIVTRTGLKASHQVSSRVEPYVSYMTESSDYDGANRTDDKTDMAIGVDYKIRRFAVLGASWTSTDFSSDAGALLDYKRSVLALTAKLSL